MANGSANDSSNSTRASVAAWMGVLFLLVVLLMGVGGYVRLSESGLSLPGWPFNQGRVLPPMTEADWLNAHRHYLDDLARLHQHRDVGKPGLGNIPPAPADMAAFRRIYWTEWLHRVLAAVVGLVGIACMVVLIKRQDLRRLAGGPLSGMVALLVVQSVIGGVLVFTGTSTSVLWIHLGGAMIILGMVLWTQLLLLHGDRPALPPPVTAQRRPLRRVAWLALGTTFVQILLGAFVAGSRHHGMSTTWPDFNGSWRPSLWDAQATLAANLLDNPGLHQFLHRWFAAAVVAVVLWLVVAARRQVVGQRCRLALNLSVSTLLTQIVLGLLNVWHGAPVLIALAHLLTAVLMVCALVVALVDLYLEPTEEGRTSPAMLAGGAP